MWLLLDKNQRRRLFLNHPAEAKPGTQRNFANHPLRYPAEIHCNQPKAAALQQNVGHFERLFQRRQLDPALPTSHPKQPRQMDSGGLPRSWVERVARIHQRTEMLARSLGQQGIEHRGLPRRSQIAATNLAERMEGNALDGIVDLRDPGGNAATLQSPINSKSGRQFLLDLSANLGAQQGGVHLVISYPLILFRIFSTLSAGFPVR